jgi:hypothetical protein
MRRLVGSNPTPAASQGESLMTKGIDERGFPLSERPRSSMLGAASLERSILGAGESVNAVVLGSGLNINWGANDRLPALSRFGRDRMAHALPLSRGLRGDGSRRDGSRDDERTRRATLQPRRSRPLLSGGRASPPCRAHIPDGDCRREKKCPSASFLTASPSVQAGGRSFADERRVLR